MIDTNFGIQNEELFINDKEVTQRNRIISDVFLYNLYLDLQKGDLYTGCVEISLTINLSSVTFEDILQLDFKGKHVQSVEVKQLGSDEEGEEAANFKTINFTFDKHRILIIVNELLNLQEIQSNQSQKSVCIMIRFSNNYNTSEEDKGLFSTISQSTETVEQNQYLYSQGEVAYMHYIFPCVEQINYRSCFQLSITHPQDWVVMSNSAIHEEVIVTNNMKNTSFEKTKPFPCYLFAIFAGNYVKYSDKYKNKIDLNIYCRKEKKEFIQHQLLDLFDMMKFGLSLMEEYTQIDYYMPKFDLVFCANYNTYGMENPGCVSIEEKRYLFEEEREPLKIMRRAYMIFHEISHFWFGDYVSLDWWNNLFLKEGFATFFGYKAVKQYFINKEEDYSSHIELYKIHILDDEKQKGMFSLSHNRLDYFDYFSFKAHNCISYNKGGCFFDFLEQKVYGELQFREKLRQFLNAYSFAIIGVEDYFVYFPDTFSKLYIYKHHLSYFQDNHFIDLIDLGLTEQDYNVLDLSYIVISKQTKHVQQVKRIDNTSILAYPTDSYLTILNLSDSHLIFTRISEEDLKFIDENDIFTSFNLQQRITIWKALLFENIQFNKTSYFNDFFLRNILKEQNSIIFHQVIKLYSQSSMPFTIEQEDTLINIFSTATNKLFKRIILKNLIRYINSNKNVFILLQIYSCQERKVKHKYLNQLQSKLENILKISIQTIQQLKINQ